VTKKRFLITSALPYANGPLHFGHMAGVYLPADIYTRHLKLSGQKCIHISGSDEHGVAISLNAKKSGSDYQTYVNSWHENHKELFNSYQIEFDFFGQTSAKYHHEETIEWFNVLNKKGAIAKEDEKQLQCQDCKNFLPDRYVEGTCYECGYANARGDECPNCGTWIDSIRLIDPVCKFCESKNIQVVDSFQWYLKMSRFQPEYDSWLATKTDWKKTVYPYLKSLASEGLVDRAITRDLDWGIDVPLEEAKNKKFYVWFDAPIGYVSNTKELLKKSDEDYLLDWWQNKDTVLTHFVGKDNIIFHGIIFPLMSMISEKARPVDQLPANQYVNLFGKQFSKSQNWYVDADQALEDFGVDAMRFYLIGLIPELQDSSFTWTGLENKVNGELANNIGNFINRCLKFYYKNYPEGLVLSNDFFTSDFFEDLKVSLGELRADLDSCQFKKAMESLLKVGFRSNEFFSEREPWAKIKTDVPHAELTLSYGVMASFLLGVFFAPFLPGLSGSILDYFDESIRSLKKDVYQLNFSKLQTLVTSSKLKIIKAPAGLVPKIDSEKIAKLSEQFTN
jgi:methionyl-tRNA synthetase